MDQSTATNVQISTVLLAILIVIESTSLVLQLIDNRSPPPRERTAELTAERSAGRTESTAPQPTGDHEPAAEEVREALRMVGRRPPVQVTPQPFTPAPEAGPGQQGSAWPGAAPTADNMPDEEELERLRRQRMKLLLQQ